MHEPAAGDSPASPARSSLLSLAAEIRHSAGRLERRMVRSYLRRQGITVPESAEFFGFPTITAVPGSTLVLGERFNAISGRRRHVMGLNHGCVIRTIRPGAHLVIGDDVGMSGATVCAAGRVEIGPNCLIGANATIVDSNFHPLAAAGRRYAPLPEPEPRDEIVIGANVFVGAGAYVLAGARIGDNSVVGAGAVVTGEVPPDSVVAGNPARVVRAL